MKQSDKFQFDRVGFINGDGEEVSCWLVKIDTEAKLERFLEIQAYEDAQIWFDIKQSPEDKMGHCKTRKASVIKDLLCSKAEKEGKNYIGLTDAMKEIGKLTSSTKIKLFIEYGELYVNQKGGCRDCHLRDDGRLDEFVFETCYNEDLIYPSCSLADIEITKWPYGQHFYITVNGTTMEVDGKEKWNTVEAAEEAKETLIKRNRFKDSEPAFKPITI